MSNAQTLRQIHIKTGVVKRLFKEISMYAEEAQQQEKVLQGLKEKEADGADIRNAERVLKDSQQMIPRTKLSLEEGYNALQDLVHALKGEAEITESKEYQAAVEQLSLVDEAKKAALGPNEA